jgi:hypothetical protein
MGTETSSEKDEEGVGKRSETSEWLRAGGKAGERDNLDPKAVRSHRKV